MPSIKSLRLILYICPLIVCVEQAFVCHHINLWNKSSGQKVSGVGASQVLDLSTGNAHFAWRCSSFLTVACEVMCVMETQILEIIDAE